MKELSIEELNVVSGGDSTPATCTTNGSTTTCTCPTGTFPAQVNGQIVCAKPN